MINGVPRILIVRLSAIGDVVRTMPALHALRDQFPDAQIDWAVEPKSYDVISDSPALDQCLVFERPEDGRLAGLRAFGAFCGRVRAGRYDVIVDFHGILKSGLITRASGAPKRWGFAPPRSRELSYLCTNRRVKLPPGVLNRIEENMALASGLGAQSDSLEVVIDIPDEIQDEVDDYFDDTFEGGKGVVAIHAPVDRPEKQWPLDYFAQLTDMILADGRYEVLLTWGPGQREVADTVRTKAHREPYVAPETPTLKHYAALVQRCDLFFGGDTGPMHIASAMSTPVVAVFGGTDPRRHAPLREPSQVLYAGPTEPPRRVSLRQARDWLDAVDPETAFDACISTAS